MICHGLCLLSLLLLAWYALQTGLCNRFEQLLDILLLPSEFVVPKLEDRVFHKLDEGDEQAPWVWAMGDQPLEKNTRDLLLHKLRVCVEDQQEDAREVPRVTVREAELVGKRVDEVISAWWWWIVCTSCALVEMRTSEWRVTMESNVRWPSEACVRAPQIHSHMFPQTTVVLTFPLSSVCQEVPALDRGPRCLPATRESQSCIQLHR